MFCLCHLFYKQMKNIIILTCAKDEHAEAVIKHVEKSKFNVILLERESYGDNWSISCIIKDGYSDVIIDYKGTKIHQSEINSIFLRRDFTVDSQNILGEFKEEEKNYIAIQRSIHVNSCIKLLSSKIPTINKSEANFTCSSKVLQLEVALKNGINTPDSFFGGDFANFKHSTINKYCLKPLEGVYLKFKDKLFVHYTELIDELSLSESESLKFCPAIIQNYVDKVYELRITIIGDKVFPCMIQSNKSKIGNIDWRRHDWANTPHYATEIPIDLENKLLKLMSDLGITYGAIDMIFDGNNYIFLEVNSMGQWLWIEEFTEMPISENIANYLMKDFQLAK